MNIEREELKMWIEDLRGDIKGVHDRLDTLNGRTRTTELNVAVLQDRANRVEQKSSRAAVVGTSAGGALIAAFELMKWWKS